MKLHRMLLPLLLLAALSGCLTGCGETEADSSANDSTSSVQSSEKGDIHVSIEEVEISLSALQAQNYTVPVAVRLENNGGFTYSEWGAYVDERCTFTADSIDAESLILSEIYSINEEKNFIWNAWAATSDFTETGDILILHVTLPENAAAGERYSITYADWSLGDTPHKWQGTVSNWAEEDAVTWTDGKITVTE